MASSKIIKAISSDSPPDEKPDIWTPLPGEITSMSIEVKENNRLHHAILNNNVKLALSIISADAKGKSAGDSSKINDMSDHNTPLILAFKTGNMKIVDALLEHPCITESIHMPDSHGLMPLHWACMLRQNEIIKKLAAMLKADDPVIDIRSFPIQTWWEKNPKDFPEITPFSLYTTPIPGYILPSAFVDNPTLRMSSSFKSKKEIVVAYTDIIFHMASLCTNLGWAGDIKFKTLSVDEHQSSIVFEKNFDLGRNSFITNRNAIAIDMEIAERLAITSDEKRALNKLKEEIAVAHNPTPSKPPTGR